MTAFANLVAAAITRQLERLTEQSHFTTNVYMTKCNQYRIGVLYNSVMGRVHRER